MKIKSIDTRPVSLTLRKFESVKVGEVFRAKDSRHNNAIAIRMTCIYNDNDEPMTNAIDLANGNQIYIYDDDEIELYTGEVEFDEAKFDKWNRGEGNDR